MKAIQTAVLCLVFATMLFACQAAENSAYSTAGLKAAPTIALKAAPTHAKSDMSNAVALLKAAPTVARG